MTSIPGPPLPQISHAVAACRIFTAAFSGYSSVVSLERVPSVSSSFIHILQPAKCHCGRYFWAFQNQARDMLTYLVRPAVINGQIVFNAHFFFPPVPHAGIFRGTLPILLSLVIHTMKLSRYSRRRPSLSSDKSSFCGPRRKARLADLLCMALRTQAGARVHIWFSVSEMRHRPIVTVLNHSSFCRPQYCCIPSAARLDVVDGIDTRTGLR